MLAYPYFGPYFYFPDARAHLSPPHVHLWPLVIHPPAGDKCILPVNHIFAVSVPPLIGAGWHDSVWTRLPELSCHNVTRSPLCLALLKPARPMGFAVLSASPLLRSSWPFPCDRAADDTDPLWHFTLCSLIAAADSGIAHHTAAYFLLFFFLPHFFLRELVDWFAYCFVHMLPLSIDVQQRQHNIIYKHRFYCCSFKTFITNIFISGQCLWAKSSLSDPPFSPLCCSNWKPE